MSFSNTTGLLDKLWTACSQQFLLRSALIMIAITIALFSRNILGRIHTVWPFFTHRYDLINSGLEKARGNVFSFNVLQHSIIATKGVDARRAFFDHKTLNLREGTKIFTGGVPRLSDLHIQNDGDDTSVLLKRIAVLLRKARLSDVIPTLFDDIQGQMDVWGKQGTIDPFKHIHDLVFQITVRMASCRELASNLPEIVTLQKHFSAIEKSSTPIVALFPWFPSPAKRAKEASTRALFTMLWHYVEERKKAPVPNSDAIDILLGQGVTNEDIIQFVLLTIFAGVANTSAVVCWFLLHISCHAHWKLAIRAEVQALLSQYAAPSEPLHKRLSAIPIAAWEDALPTLELALRETMRIVINGHFFRRNVSTANISFPGLDREVPSGGFVAYASADVHMDPKIYTDPEVFDPERFSHGREEDKRCSYAFLAWGVGRHPCAGMKVAKLEIKMIAALFVVGYEYDVVDSKGRIPEKLPEPDYNDARKRRAKGDPCFIRFKRVVE